MAVLTRAALVFGVLLAPGCGDAGLTRTAPEGLVEVYGVLRTGSDTAAVLVRRFEEGKFASPPLSGADVRLIAGTDTLRLPEAPQGMLNCIPPERTDDLPRPAEPGCYTALLPGGVRPGETYRLWIGLPEGGEVRGTAVVPELPRMSLTEGGARFQVRNGGMRDGRPLAVIPVFWSAGAGTARVEVSLAPGGPLPGTGPRPGNRCVADDFASPTQRIEPVDSADLWIYELQCFRGLETAAWDSVSARLVVTAYDTAYAHYAREVLGRSGARLARFSAGLVGAVGVFAGSASDEQQVMLLRQPPPGVLPSRGPPTP